MVVVSNHLDDNGQWPELVLRWSEPHVCLRPGLGSGGGRPDPGHLPILPLPCAGPLLPRLMELPSGCFSLSAPSPQQNKSHQSVHPDTLIHTKVVVTQ